MRFIGVDPDLHNTAIAVLDEQGKVVDVRVVKVPKHITGRDAVVAMCSEITEASHFFFGDGGHDNALAVEAQEIYHGGSHATKNTKSIVLLAAVAGACLASFESGYKGCDYFPSPQQWKGSVPKQVHQARILTKLGWGYSPRGSKESGYCIPSEGEGTEAFNLTNTDWKHAVDAIGLAQYARERYIAERDKQQFLQTRTQP